MEIFDPLITHNILINSSYDVIINYCLTHLEAQKICRNSLFWEQKAYHDFKISADKFNNTSLTADMRYVQILTEEGGIASMSNKFMETRKKFIKRAVKLNRVDLLNPELYSKQFDLLIIDRDINVSNSLNNYTTKLEPEKLLTQFDQSEINIVPDYNFLNDLETLASAYARKGDVNRVIYYLSYVMKFKNVKRAALKSANTELLNKIKEIKMWKDRLDGFRDLKSIISSGNYDIYTEHIKVINDEKKYTLNPRDYTDLMIKAIKSDNIEFADWLAVSYEINNLNTDIVKIYDKILIKNDHNQINSVIHKFLYDPYYMDHNLSFFLSKLLSSDSDVFEDYYTLLPTSFRFQWFLAVHNRYFNYKNIQIDNLIYLIENNPIYNVDHAAIKVIAKGALFSGRYDIFNYIYNNILNILSNDQEEYNMLLGSAFLSYKDDIITYIINSMPTNYNINWSYVFDIIDEITGPDVLDGILKFFPKDSIPSWTLLTEKIVNKETLKYAISIMPPNTKLNYSKIIENAIDSNNIDYIIYAYNLAPEGAPCIYPT